MPVPELASYISRQYAPELRGALGALQLMKDTDQQTRVEGVVMFLASSTAWTGGEATAVKADLKRRLINLNGI